jgi:hypothetical protein
MPATLTTITSLSAPGLMTRIDGDLIPEIYPTEPLTAWLNEQAAHSAVTEGSGWL